MERTYMPHPKIFLHIHILQKWEVKPKDLGALIPYSPYKEIAYIHRILVSSISLYKHQTPSSPRYVEFTNSHTFRVIRNHSVTNLRFKGSLVDTPLVLSIGFLSFILQIPSNHCASRRSTHLRFCTSSLLGFKTLGTNVLELQFVLCWQTMIKT